MTMLLLAVQVAPTPPVPPAPVPGTTVVREIVIRDGKHDKQAVGSTGADRALLDRCDGETLVDVDERSTADQGKDQQRTRVLICRAKGSSEVSAVQRLREAQKRLSADSTLSVEARNRIVLAINAAIARLDARE